MGNEFPGRFGGRFTVVGSDGEFGVEPDRHRRVGGILPKAGCPSACGGELPVGDELLDERGDDGRGAVWFGRDVEERLARLQPVAEFVLKPGKQDTLFDVEFAPALQFIEERDGLPPALRLFAIHENRKLDPNVLWGQFSFGIDVLPENAESLLEFAI